jgi:hypothetical protein
MHGIKSFLRQKLNANDISIAAKKNTRSSLTVAIKNNTKANDDVISSLKSLNDAVTQLNLSPNDPLLVDKVTVCQSIYDQKMTVAALTQNVVDQSTSTNTIVENLRSKVKLLSTSTTGAISDNVLSSLTQVADKPSQLNDLMYKINTHVSVSDVIAEKLIESKTKLSDVTKKLNVAITKGNRPDLIATLSGEQLDAQTEVDRQQKLMNASLANVTDKISNLNTVLPFDENTVPVIDVSALDLPAVVGDVSDIASETTDVPVTPSVVTDNSSLIATYQFFVDTPSSTNEHLPTIKSYASQCTSVLEITNAGHSTLYGFLLGLSSNTDPAAKVFFGIYPKIEDIDQLTNASVVAAQNAIKFDYVQTDEFSVDISTFANSDITLIDTVNTYAHTFADLNKFSGLTSKYIMVLSTSGDWEFTDEVVPDYSIFSEVSQDKHGVWPAVMDFVQSNPNWQIERRDINNNGLVVLKKY